MKTKRKNRYVETFVVLCLGGIALPLDLTVLLGTIGIA